MWVYPGEATPRAINYIGFHLQQHRQKRAHYYRPQRSCEGYVFTGVCLSTGGVGVSASVHAGIPLLEQTPPSRHPPRETPPRTRHPPSRPPSQEQTPPRPDTPPQSRTPREQTPPPPRYGHCCGRYASYWNAF